MESATPCHDVQVVGSYRASNPLRLTVLAAKSEDYTTALHHLQCSSPHSVFILQATYSVSVEKLFLSDTVFLVIFTLQRFSTVNTSDKKEFRRSNFCMFETSILFACSYQSFVQQIRDICCFNSYVVNLNYHFRVLSWHGSMLSKHTTN